MTKMKASQKVTTILMAFVGLAFILPQTASAQGAPTVWVSQGVLSTSTLVSGSSGFYTMKLGSGFAASTTGAIVSATATHWNGFVPNYTGVVLDIEIYSDSAYMSNVGQCRFNSNGAADTSVDGFVQLAFLNAAGTGCVITPDQYVTVGIYPTQNGASSFQLDGTYTPVRVSNLTTSGNAQSGFYPMFSLIGNGWSLIPTTTDSGLSLSGAQAFCDGQFGTSTSFLSGSYWCQIAGYLFIPSQNSVQQFAGLGDQVAQKIPFAYFYDVASILSNLTASSTENMRSFNIGLDQLDFASSTGMGPILPTSLDFLSTTTINRYLPQGMHDLLYNLFVVAIWVDVAWLLYHKIVPRQVNI